MIAIDPVTESCIADEVEQIACATRVFISMPYVKGVTPHVLADVGKREHTSPEGQGERLYGIFRIDEVGIPAFDHGLLYGDAVFEGILISSRQLFQWREHVERLYRSAALLQIDIPYSPSELTTRVLETVKETPAATNEHAYIRLIVSRGIGDLGLHPRKCAGSTICAIVSQIRFYAPFLYERGISLALAQRTRRSSANILNPQIKCCNYVNQVLALLETMDEDA